VDVIIQFVFSLITIIANPDKQNTYPINPDSSPYLFYSPLSDKRKTRQLRSDASPLTIGTSKETEKPSALVEPKRASKEKLLEDVKEAQDEEAELFNLNPNLKRPATEGESTSEPYNVLIKVPRRDGRFYCPKCNKDFIRKDRVSPIWELRFEILTL
jgi:hypothetical protein